ncbi:MAG: hypothetical protein PHW04_17775 [Candidatus Wallbacteria bacterium]|nr:hypothetical protein [Candidatus Wallbacteria bacterium]
MPDFFNLYSPVYDPFMRLYGLYRPGLIRKSLKPKNTDLVLDLGGGTGFIAEKLKSLVKDVIVSDRSLGMLKIIRNIRKMDRLPGFYRTLGGCR